MTSGYLASNDNSRLLSLGGKISVRDLYNYSVVANPKATGGAEVVSGGYRYHTFLSTSSLNVTVGGLADVLIIAGGASGGAVGSDRGAGGGGAGGAKLHNNVYLVPGSIIVTVGSGGAGVAASNIGNPGNHSAFGDIVVPGGGAGSPAGVPGMSGACAGGNGDRYGISAIALPGYGFGGGSTSGLDPDSGGGGGGMGGAGASVGSGQGGAGGAGINTYSAWATATSTGVSGFYCGGGGGRGESSIGSGGSGGGGAGAANGTANTGGGGGGNRGAASGSGGSGLVIVRYLV